MTVDDPGPPGPQAAGVPGPASPTSPAPVAGLTSPTSPDAAGSLSALVSPTKSVMESLRSRYTRHTTALQGPALELKRTPTWQRMLLIKTVGWIGGLSLLSNNMLGPGLVTVPLLFQQAGWILPVAAFLTYGTVAAFASLFIVEAMQSVPGNRRFKGIVEFSTLISFYFGPIAAYLAQIVLFLSLQSTNIASIIVSVQTMDNIVIEIFKRTCGIIVKNGALVATCVTTVSSSNSPFGNDFLLLSIGLLITVVVIVPLGLTKIGDNVFVQVIATAITFVIFVTWIYTFSAIGLNPGNVVPGRANGIGSVFSTVLFNYAYVTTIPSWVNVRAPSVSITRSIWGVTFSSVTFYILVGVFACLAFADMPENSNILTVINSSPQANVWTRITSYAFPVASLMSSIPIFVIIAYQNLIQNNITGRPLGILLSAVLPFLVAIPLQSGAGLQQFIVWSSLIATSTANFLLPLFVYLRSKRFLVDWNEKGGMSLNQHQRDLLLAVHPWSKSVVAFVQDLEAIEEGVEVEDDGVVDEVEDDYKFTPKDDSREGLISGEAAEIRPQTPETPLSINVVPPEDDGDIVAEGEPGTGTGSEPGTGSSRARSGSRLDYFGEGPWAGSTPDSGAGPHGTVAAAASFASQQPDETPTPAGRAGSSGVAGGSVMGGAIPSPSSSADRGTGVAPIAVPSRTTPTEAEPETPGTASSSRSSLGSRRNRPVPELNLGSLSNYTGRLSTSLPASRSLPRNFSPSSAGKTPGTAGLALSKSLERGTPGLGLAGVTVPATTPGWSLDPSLLTEARATFPRRLSKEPSSTPISPLSPTGGEPGGMPQGRTSSHLLAVPPVFGAFRDDPLNEDDWHIPRVPSGGAWSSRSGSIFAYNDNASGTSSSPGGHLRSATGEQPSGDLREASRPGSNTLSIRAAPSSGNLGSEGLASSPPRARQPSMTPRVVGDHIIQIGGVDADGLPRRRSSLNDEMLGRIATVDPRAARTRSRSPSPARIPPPLVVPPNTLARARKRVSKGKSNFLAEELNNALVFTEMKGSLFGITRGPVVPMTPTSDEPSSAFPLPTTPWDRSRHPSAAWTLPRWAGGTTAAAAETTKLPGEGAQWTPAGDADLEAGTNPRAALEAWERTVAAETSHDGQSGSRRGSSAKDLKPVSRAGSTALPLLTPIEISESFGGASSGPGTSPGGVAGRRRRHKSSNSMLKLTLPPLAIARSTSTTSIQSLKTARPDLGPRDSYFPLPSASTSGPMSARPLGTFPFPRTRVPGMIPRALPAIEASPIVSPNAEPFDAQGAAPVEERGKGTPPPKPSPSVPSLTVDVAESVKDGEPIEVESANPVDEQPEAPSVPEQPVEPRKPVTGKSKSPLSLVARLSAPRIPELPETPIHGSFPRLASTPMFSSTTSVAPDTETETEASAPIDVDVESDRGMVIDPSTAPQDPKESSLDAAQFRSPAEDAGALFSPTTLGDEKELPLTFRSAEFHTLPFWLPFDDLAVAYFSLVLLSVTIFGVFVYSIVDAVRG